MIDYEEKRSETRHRMGFMTPLLVFVLAFVACCGVIACVFLRAAIISDEAARGSAGIALCVAIFGVLTVSSAVSDRRAAERYGEHVEVLYACENAGQDWLSEADAYLKGAGDLPENTEETETTLKTEIKRGNMQLEICLNKINGSYEIAKWRCTARWQPDDSLNLG